MTETVETVIARAATWALCIKAGGRGPDGGCEPHANCVCGGEGDAVAPAVIAAIDAAGYVIVPKEAIPVMRTAGAAAIRRLVVPVAGGVYADGPIAGDIFSAMLAAAREPSA